MTVRPKTLETFVGKEKNKEVIKIAMKAAQRRKRALTHILIEGYPGTGKTTFANIIANEMGVKMHSFVGQSIGSETQLMMKILEVRGGEILFIDEIHNLDKGYAELLYTVMEDSVLSIALGDTVEEYPIEPITVIGSTTEAQTLEKPLVDRFGIRLAFDLYTPEDLTEIVRINSEFPIEDEAAELIAKVGRNTPRIAINYLDAVEAYVDSIAADEITLKSTETMLEKLSINKYGLNEVDMRILTSMMKIFGGKPVGIEKLAGVVNQSKKVICEQHEPYLMEQGFIVSTPQGRRLTPKSLRIIMEAGVRA